MRGERKRGYGGSWGQGQGQWKSRVGVREQAEGWRRRDVRRAKGGNGAKKGQVREENRQQVER